MFYTDLIFDLYGTLVDIHTNQEKEEVWEKLSVYFGFYGAAFEPEELRKRYEELTAGANAAAGQSYECFPELSLGEIFSGLFREKGVTGDVENLAINAAQFFRILSIEYIRLYPGVKEALISLRGRGHRLWLLSNAQRLFTAYELRHLGISDCFDGIYISSDFGCRKPDRRFFSALLTQRRLDPESCLMIGNDLACDIEGARSAGLHSFYIHSNLSPKEDAEALKGLQNGMEADPGPCSRPVKGPDFVTEETDWNAIYDEIVRADNEKEQRGG